MKKTKLAPFAGAVVLRAIDTASKTPQNVD